MKTIGLLDEAYLSTLDVWGPPGEGHDDMQMAADIGILQHFVVQHPGFHPLTAQLEPNGSHRDRADFDKAFNYPLPVVDSDGSGGFSNHPTETVLL